MTRFYQQNLEWILDHFKTNPATGLIHTKVLKRHKQYGPNQIKSTASRTIYKILADQILNPMILLLLAVVVVSLFIAHYTDAAIIGIIVVINALIGFSQEYKAEKAMESIREMASPTARVLREGSIYVIEAKEIVPGDMVILEAGDRIPADLRLIEVKSLKVDESLLTGESLPVFKNSEIPYSDKSDIPLGDQHNMGFMGTHVVVGRATGICVATGMQTELGHIAGLLAKRKEEVPLKKRTNRLTRQMSLAALGLSALIFLVGTLQGVPLLQMLLAATALAVAAIPEGLPAVITISLSLGSLRLARQGMLVRQLPAVEALGSITMICTDKTGTLTKNQMEVQYPPPEEKNISPYFYKALALCNDAQLATNNQQKATGDPMEIALLRFVKSRGLDPAELKQQYPRLEEIPFDTQKKRMTTLHQEGNQQIVFVKGAPEMVIPLCSHEMTEAKKSQIFHAQEKLAQQGLRVLAVSYKKSERIQNKEQDMIFLGLVGLKDPPREEVFAAIQACRQAGIKPLMITGDYKITAQAIGRDLGLWQTGDFVLEGSDLQKLSHDHLKSHLSKASILARVSPQDKLTIVELLKKQHEIVAMTGDGVNDAPALKRADVGIAMGRGTDVAKEASSLIMVNENFATIVSAIREGRIVYDNIRKFVRYMLTTNWGEISTMLLATMMGYPVILLPVQILWINLVTDGLPAIALGFEPAEGNIMARKPRPKKQHILSQGLWLHILWVGLLMGMLTLLVAYYSSWQGESMTTLRTMAFTTLTFAQMGHVLGIRSEFKPLWKIGLFSNYRLLIAVLITVIAQVLLVYWPPLQKIFYTTTLTMQNFIICLVSALIIYAAVEIEKWGRSQKEQ